MSSTKILAFAIQTTTFVSPVLSPENRPGTQPRRVSFRPRAAAGDHGLMGSPSKSFYELLGISEAGSFDDVKRAYKQMARRYHPDVCPKERAEECTRMFIEVQEAYETLSNPKRRAVYDRGLAGGFHLAFSPRRMNDEGIHEKSEWSKLWQDQIYELRKRSTHHDSGGNMSWGARMRRQHTETASDATP